MTVRVVNQVCVDSAACHQTLKTKYGCDRVWHMKNAHVLFYDGTDLNPDGTWKFDPVQVVADVYSGKVIAPAA